MTNSVTKEGVLVNIGDGLEDKGQGDELTL